MLSQKKLRLFSVIIFALLAVSVVYFRAARRLLPRQSWQTQSEAAAARAVVLAKINEEELKLITAKQAAMHERKPDPKLIVSGPNMMVVKEKGFQRAEEPLKSPLEIMDQMAKERAQRKGAMVRMSEGDLNKKVYSPSLDAQKGGPLSKGVAPSGERTITAPVNYQLFKTEEDYKNFTSSRAGNFPPADFSSKMVILLVSASSFPNRIFSIVETKQEKDKIVVKYKIDPLAAAKEEVIDDFACAVIPKSNLPIILEQVL
ncbi:MAG: hypothetical protein NTW04_02300 [Elusimicrobia bacterium]|nr:hypothetical protein [Elusimicrobiota bacterium]